MGTKENRKPKKTTLRGMEVVEFPRTPRLEQSDSRRDNNQLINHTIIPVTIQVELKVVSSGCKGILATILDSGCTRCLVNPGIVEKLGVHLRELKPPIAFF